MKVISFVLVGREGNCSRKGCSYGCILSSCRYKFYVLIVMNSILMIHGYVGAFHTEFMAPAVDTLKKVLSEVEIKQTRFPVFSNVDAKPHGSPDEIREKLALQVTKPVQWETIITEMVKVRMYSC